MAKLSQIKKWLKIDANNKITLDNIKYFNELNNNETIELTTSKLVACDCNKKNLLYMTDVNENTYRYTSAQYNNEIRSKKINKKIQFAEETNDEELYYKTLWGEYLNKKRSAKKLVQNIKQKYGNNIIILIGDCSGENQTHIFQWLLTILVNNFKVYKVDEYKTTIINCRTFEKNTNDFKRMDKYGNQFILNSVLTYTCKNGRQGCINRDRNASNNILYIVMYWIELFEFLTGRKNIDSCNYIKNDIRLETFISNNKITENMITEYLQQNGRPIQFL